MNQNDDCFMSKLLHIRRSAVEFRSQHWRPKTAASGTLARSRFRERRRENRQQAYRLLLHCPWHRARLMKRGDVVLMDYPFSDGTGSKVRPALVVSS